MMKIVTCEQARQIDRKAADKGLTTTVLTENAGRAVALEVAKALGSIEGKNILVLAGKGNNGSDGMVAARNLIDMKARATIYMSGYRDPLEDISFQSVQQRGIPLIRAEEDANFSKLEDALKSADAVIDAFLGTGRARPLEGAFKSALEKTSVSKARRPSMLIIGLDVPSGLDPDTGTVDGATPFCDMTIALGFPKTGLFQFPGASRVGKLIVADIGLPAELASDITIELMTDGWARSALPRRPLNANKGTFGRVLVVAGSINFIGAAYFCCMSAYRVGAGLVTLATPTSLQGPLAAKLTEATFLPLPQSATGVVSEDAFNTLKRELMASNVMLMGPGLGKSKAALEFMKSTLSNLQPASSPNIVLDADALDAVKEVEDWSKKLPRQMILTPHPGEMSRMISMSMADVQKDRIGLARRMAKEWDNTVVLKGAHTVVAAFDGHVMLSPFANPGLASGGTGDVLSGAISGLLAQGVGFFDSAALGVYLHGMAGEMVRQELGDTGMIADDLLPIMPRAIKKLRETGVSWAEPVAAKGIVLRAYK
ncbi:MAG TPA: NAD(P)H-hydrate dehydratase [Dehalococcoidia bacterium]|nr:NAD(P)H-hydrate dehydratase [Dehalococcoidia bacterium]